MNSHQTNWLIFGVLSAAVGVLCVIMIAFALMPRTPKAVATFNRFFVDAGGSPQAMFTVTNQGGRSLRRLDFYVVQVQGFGGADEYDLGPESTLAPGDSETLLVDVPANDVPWKVAFYFSDESVVERTASESDVAPVEKRHSSRVDMHTDSEWITFTP